MARHLQSQMALSFANGRVYTHARMSSRGDLYDAQDVFRSFLFALILVPKPENLHP
jgi:hypothetical protein